MIRAAGDSTELLSGRKIRPLNRTKIRKTTNGKPPDAASAVSPLHERLVHKRGERIWSCPEVQGNLEDLHRQRCFEVLPERDFMGGAGVAERIHC